MDTYGYTHQHTNSDTNRCTNANAYPDADGHMDIHSHVYQYTNNDTNRYTNANDHSHAHRHTYGYPIQALLAHHPEELRSLILRRDFVILRSEATKNLVLW